MVTLDIDTCASKNSPVMKIFMINLARRPERLEYMKHQMISAGIAFERIDAVDGMELTGEERRKAIRAFRWWCVNGYAARPGEIGCALSHQMVYRKMIDENLSTACVLEDDVRLDTRFCEVAKAAEDFLCSKGIARVLIMTPYKGRKECDATRPMLTRVDWAASTGGYILNVEAAKRLLEVNTPLVGPADNWGRWARKGHIELYTIDPIACWQDAYASIPDNPAFASDTIDAETVFVKDMPVARRVLHKMGRVIGITIDKVLPEGGK